MVAADLCANHLSPCAKPQSEISTHSPHRLPSKGVIYPIDYDHITWYSCFSSKHVQVPPGLQNFMESSEHSGAKQFRPASGKQSTANSAILHHMVDTMRKPAFERAKNEDDGVKDNDWTTMARKRSFCCKRSFTDELAVMGWRMDSTEKCRPNQPFSECSSWTAGMTHVNIRVFLLAKNMVSQQLTQILWNKMYLE